MELSFCRQPQSGPSMTRDDRQRPAHKLTSRVLVRGDFQAPLCIMRARRVGWCRITRYRGGAMERGGPTHVERRLAAILAGDVAEYARRIGADEEGTHERLKACLRQLVDPKIKEHRGRIVKNTGDGCWRNFRVS